MNRLSLRCFGPSHQLPASAGAVLAVVFSTQSAFSQATIPTEALRQLQDTVGARVEAVTVLGGDYGAAGGIYTFRGGTLASLSVSKIGGAGEVAQERSLGLGDVTWAPVLQGNVGYVQAGNQINRGFLRGNVLTYDVAAAQFGGGARFHFNEHLSVAPTVSGMYGHVENELVAHNGRGRFVEQNGRGRFVDWSADTWSVTPSVDGIYEWTWGRTRWEFTSRYSFFHTESFQSSTPFVSIEGDSHTLENKVDVDVPLGWKVFGRELHTGGFFSRTELFGGISDGLRENHIYTANGRLVLDFSDKSSFLRWIGLGGSYFFGDAVSGWSAGLDMRFEFK
jgi:hypothetical protein